MTGDLGFCVATGLLVFENPAIYPFSPPPEVVSANALRSLNSREEMNAAMCICLCAVLVKNRKIKTEKKSDIGRGYLLDVNDVGLRVYRIGKKYNTILRHDTVQYNTIQHTVQPNPIQYDMIRQQAVQYYTIRYDTAQCNTIRYSTIQYDTKEYKAMRYDTIQYNMTRYGTIRYDTIRYSTVQ